jgi:hypothetical protein
MTCKRPVRLLSGALDHDLPSVQRAALRLDRSFHSACRLAPLGLPREAIARHRVAMRRAWAGARLWRVVRAITAAAALLMLAGLAQGQTCAARSGQERVPLLELYTSEGCDSCPPADRWLASTGAEAFRNGRAVPLALHVDYWDQLGWRDRFASAAFTTRQRDAAAQRRTPFVYTPQVLINGSDFRAWRDPSAFQRALRAATVPAQAALGLNLERDPGGKRWLVKLEASTEVPDAHAYLALYESGLVTDVRAGENRGAQLRHDFVVRQWLGPMPLERLRTLQRSATFAVSDEGDERRAGVVAFLQAPDGNVLQALALPLCPS